MTASNATEERNHEFCCNICGKRNSVPLQLLGRDNPSCRRCRSSVRLRSVIHALSLELFGRCLPIAQFPKLPQLRGVGLSDVKSYASRLKRRLGYVNTYYHRRPRLDITEIDESAVGTLDFLIATDVFEHIEPPLERAFVNARRLLKPGGVMVFSVPYGNEGKTAEHFPELADYRLRKSGGKTVLHNRTVDGREQVFEDLVFHGGKGDVLELRIFSLPDLLEWFADAGFAPPRIHRENHFECGMVWEHTWSMTMSVRAPENS